MRVVGEITTASGRLPLISFLSSVGQRVKLGGHHPELVRKRRVMGIGHLAKALRTVPQELNLPAQRHVLSQSV